MATRVATPAAEGRGVLGRGGVGGGAFEAASPGQSKEPGQSKRLEQITALRFNYSPPDTTSPLFVFTALAYHRAASRELQHGNISSPPPPSRLSFFHSFFLSLPLGDTREVDCSPSPRVLLFDFD